MATVKIKADTRGFNRGVDRATNKLGKFNDKLNRGVGQGVQNVGALTTKFGRLGQSLGSLAPRLGKVGSQLNGVGSAAGAAGGGVGALATGLVAAGAAAVAFSVKAVKAFTNVERQAFNYARITDDIAANQERAQEFAFDLSARTGVGTGNIFGALYQVRSAGGEDEFGTAEAATQLESVSGVSAAQFAPVLVNLQKVGLENGRNAANFILQAEKMLQVTPDALAQVFGELIPLTQQMGLSMAESVGALDALTASGLTAQKGFTQLRALINELANPNSRAGRFFQETYNNQTFGEVAAQKDLIQIFKELVAAAGGQEELRVLLGREEGQLALGSLLSNEQEYQDTRALLEEQGTQELERQVQSRNQTAFAALDRLHASLEITVARLGKELEPLVSEWFETIERVISDPEFADGVEQLANLFVDLGLAAYAAGSLVAEAIGFIQQGDDILRRILGDDLADAVSFGKGDNLLEQLGGGTGLLYQLSEDTSGLLGRLGRNLWNDVKNVGSWFGIGGGGKKEEDYTPYANTGALARDAELRRQAILDAQNKKHRDEALLRDVNIRRRASGRQDVHAEEALIRDTRLRRQSAGLTPLRDDGSLNVSAYQVDSDALGLAGKYAPQLSAIEQLQVDRSILETAITDARELYDQGATHLSGDIERMVAALGEINSRIADIRDSNEEIADNTAPHERDVSFIYAPITPVPSERGL